MDLLVQPVRLALLVLLVWMEIDTIQKQPPF